MLAAADCRGQVSFCRVRHLTIKYFCCSRFNKYYTSEAEILLKILLNLFRFNRHVFLPPSSYLASTCRLTFCCPSLQSKSYRASQKPTLGNHFKVITGWPLAISESKKLHLASQKKALISVENRREELFFLWMVPLQFFYDCFNCHYRLALNIQLYWNLCSQTSLKKCM